ncbi:hypothetical protein QL996_14855 [Planococcus sp. APC 4015]|nr:hypothetical protein [Planococcus sp. APC 4015]
MTRVVGVADTDSYVKWGAALLGAAPDGWDVSLLVLDTPLSVSASQLESAVAGSGFDAPAVRRVSFGEFEAVLQQHPPDAVLLAARGPLVRVLARSVVRVAPQAVIVSGLPGISIPATRKALRFRERADLFVVHSHREVRDFARVAALDGLHPHLALATLPFARRAERVADAQSRGDLVFAAQAKVPSERADRLTVARLLIAAARASPEHRVVLKLRGEHGEHQTHAESDPYPQLLAEIGDRPANLVTSTQPMSLALDRADGLVTISSTAAIEAIARGIPVIALDTFGVSDELINPVFEESGLLGSAGDVIARRFRHPEPSWVRDNYLHDRADDDWAEHLDALVTRRRAGMLSPRSERRRTGGRLRDAWDRKVVLGPMDRSVSGAFALVIGMPLRAATRGVQRLRRGLAPAA